ncbi:MAG TPA: hypothetical protein DCG54_05600 [Anaerolineae bacterium]|jgi:hypothetical protein|nr:hypothetical protein [Anaerolineae bacterium]
MGITTEKLSEAKFFLEQIEANYLEHPAFDYFLGAFISSARSVLWIMRSEFNDIAGWESWYKSLEPSTSDEALLQKINVARIRTEKQAPLKTNFRVSLTIPKEQFTEKLRQELESMVNKTTEFSVKPVSVRDNLADLSPTNNGLNFIGEIESIYRVLGELGDDDVLVVCREYFATIKNVVFECENRFG